MRPLIELGSSVALRVSRDSTHLPSTISRRRPSPNDCSAKRTVGSSPKRVTRPLARGSLSACAKIDREAGVAPSRCQRRSSGGAEAGVGGRTRSSDSATDLDSIGGDSAESAGVVSACCRVAVTSSRLFVGGVSSGAGRGLAGLSAQTPTNTGSGALGRARSGAGAFSHVQSNAPCNSSTASQTAGCRERLGIKGWPSVCGSTR